MLHGRSFADHLADDLLRTGAERQLNGTQRRWAQDQKSTEADSRKMRGAPGLTLPL